MEASRKDIIVIMGSTIAIISGLIAIFSYVNSRDHRKLEETNSKLEFEINQLQLAKLKNGNSNANANNV